MWQTEIIRALNSRLQCIWVGSSKERKWEKSSNTMMLIITFNYIWFVDFIYCHELLSNWLIHFAPMTGKQKLSLGDSLWSTRSICTNLNSENAQFFVIVWSCGVSNTTVYVRANSHESVFVLYNETCVSCLMDSTGSLLSLILHC